MTKKAKTEEKGKKQRDTRKILTKAMAIILATLMILSVAATLIYYLTVQ